MLKKMLDEADPSPPYILVGHSVGGAYALRFAILYPEEVAGIVLIDARLKDFREKCQAAGFSLCSPPGIVGVIMPDHVREELRGLEESEAELPEPEELGNIPITVIAATDPPPYAPAGLQELWLEVQRDFASRLANGRFVLAEGTGHYIHRDDPDLVIREVSYIIDLVRAGR
jgi:pimeloyl-ACP methyl ester carboxylesterase